MLLARVLLGIALLASCARAHDDSSINAAAVLGLVEDMARAEPKHASSAHLRAAAAGKEHRFKADPATPPATAAAGGKAAAGGEAAAGDEAAAGGEAATGGE